MADPARIKEAENFLAQIILDRGSHLDSTDIPQIVEEFRSVFSGGYYQFQQADFDLLTKSLEIRYVTTMGAGVSLIDQDVAHDEDWYQNREIGWDYWDDYEKYLINRGWPSRVVSSINSVTDKVLGLLQDPLKQGDWERRGLVIGHVQSGKTANYIGLITKAADAGYKFIIVITGIHNVLRTQTQERIDAGFIGWDSQTKHHIGVGQLRPTRAMPVTVTTTESDFNKALAKRFGMELKSLNNTFILVIKKNVSTLSSLYNWLRELNTREELEKITDIPMLLIDDEADHASINTNKPELDPTRTNREIRNILNLFRKRCYVGYTATPFANIFINPDDWNERLGNDLFPEHFIYSLDAPTNYYGYEKIFLDESGYDRFIREIEDAEDFIPLRHSKDEPVHDLPPSLKKAIRTFILSRAIRNLRGQKTEHCSMLINVSRFVSTQNEVRQLTEFYLNQLKKAVRFNYKLPISKALEDSFISQLYQDFCDEYHGAGLEWESVLAELNDAADAAKVVLVNSKSDEALLYTAYAKEGNALTVIAIGGFSLSRGLTLEGLTVSYIYRNSKMYDTLMQMGRWFGYRDNYDDLCRIYMSDVSYGWYSHIAEATEELRVQIKRMRRERKKPIDFGLYVRAHPSTLIVTAMNKMRYTENRVFHISYDGKLMETHIVPASQNKTELNRNLLKISYADLRNLQEPVTDNTNSYLFRDIEWEWVQDFIMRFNFHADMFDLKESIPSFIKEVSDLYPLWDVTFRSLAGRPREEGYPIATQERDIGHTSSGLPRRPISEPGWHVGNKSRFSGNSMFLIGLDKAQLQEAQVQAVDDGRKTPIYRDYTNARGKPLLMLHILNLVDKKDDNKAMMSIVPAISVSFPNLSEFRTVEYVVGPVWLKQFEQDQYDTADDEDDYDPEL